jgi:predicted nucleotidyltransferase
MTTVTIDLAEHVIAILRAHETELRQAGIMRLSLFGSVARGEERADSDVDLAARTGGKTSSAGCHRAGS